MLSQRRLTGMWNTAHHGCPTWWIRILRLSPIVMIPNSLNLSSPLTAQLLSKGIMLYQLKTSTARDSQSGITWKPPRTHNYSAHDRNISIKQPAIEVMDIQTYNPATYALTCVGGFVHISHNTWQLPNLIDLSDRSAPVGRTRGGVILRR